MDVACVCKFIIRTVWKNCNMHVNIISDLHLINHKLSMGSVCTDPAVWSTGGGSLQMSVLNAGEMSDPRALKGLTNCNSPAAASGLAALS